MNETIHKVIENVSNVTFRGDTVVGSETDVECRRVDESSQMKAGIHVDVFSRSHYLLVNVKVYILIDEVVTPSGDIGYPISPGTRNESRLLL